jgi:prepilin-type N-terminal cleavage/methylation domain-containing protein
MRTNIIPSSRTRRRAFTLIELLVVIAIIALLVSILLPSLNRAKELAKLAVCKTNLHGISIAMNMYTQENRGVFLCADDPVDPANPGVWLWMGRGWRNPINPYLGYDDGNVGPSALFCPSDPSEFKYSATSYAYSMSFYHSPEQINTMTSPADTYSNPRPSVAQTADRMRSPSQKIMIGEWSSNHHRVDNDGGWWGWEGTRNFLLGDGSIRFLRAEDIRPANDALPDPNLTIDGIAGSDL